MFAGPGAGKTLGALLAFKAMQQQGRLQRFVVFCHRTSILSQWQSAAQRLGLRLEEWPCSDQADGLLITYQGAGRQLEQLREDLRQWGLAGSLAIADEAHHLGLDPDEPITVPGEAHSLSSPSTAACAWGSPAPRFAPTTWPSALPVASACAKATR